LAQKRETPRQVAQREPAGRMVGGMGPRQTPGGNADDPRVPGESPASPHLSRLVPYPQPCLEGMRTPFDLWRYAGKGRSSWGSPQLRMSFVEWIDLHREQKPSLMADVKAYMNSRYDFSGVTISGVWMSGRRRGVPAGPVARLPKGIGSFQELARLSPEEIKGRDLFPYKPIAHPLQSTTHTLFPGMW